MQKKQEVLLVPYHFSCKIILNWTLCFCVTWDPKAWAFLTFEENEKKENFENLVDTMIAEKEVFISATLNLQWRQKVTT